MPRKREPKDTDITDFIPEQHNLYAKRMVFLGPSEAGKSWVIRDIMQKLPRIPVGRILAGSEDYDPFYRNFCPDIFISSEFDLGVIKKFFDRAKELTKLKKTNPKYKHVNNRSLLLLDDCFHKKAQWMKEDLIGELVMNGRHAEITLMFAMQSPKGFQGELKGSIDYAFICQFTSATDRKTIYDNYSAGFKTYSQFSKAMDKVCIDNHVMVIKRNNKKSSKIIDNVFIYKAKEHPGFKMFSPLAWRIHNKKYDKNFETKIKLRKEKEEFEQKNKERLKHKRREEITHDIEIIRQ